MDCPVLVKARIIDRLRSECKDCLHASFCSNCLVRGFLMAKERRDDCRWLSEKVPGIIKQNMTLQL